MGPLQKMDEMLEDAMTKMTKAEHDREGHGGAIAGCPWCDAIKKAEAKP